MRRCHRHSRELAGWPAAPSVPQLNHRKGSMPINEHQLAEILTQRTGREVTAEEVDDFLHEEFNYEQRMSMHDVLSCQRCGGGKVEIFDA